MKLNGLIFSHFYKVVTDHIYSNELIEAQRKKFKSDGSAIWYERPFSKEKGPFIYDLYLPSGTDQDYLIKLKSKFKADTGLEIEVNDKVIIHCLEKKLDGYPFPQEIPKEYALIDRIRAKVLMQLFIRKNLSTYYLDNLMYYEVYDEKHKKLIIDNLNRKKPKGLTSTKSQTDNTTFEITPDELWRFQTHRKLLEFIEQYFKLLNDHNFKAAMNMWHPVIRQQAWGNKVAEFQRVYWTLEKVSLKGLYLEDKQPNESIHKFRVMYVEEITIQYAEDLFDLLDNTALNDTKKIVSSINSFLARTERNNFRISELPLKSLLDFSAIEQLHILGAYDQQRLENVLPDRRKMGLYKSILYEVEVAPSGEFLFYQALYEQVHNHYYETTW
ncbi:hypothetical protein BEL04_18185 [Mucilaginibacter sp. PPCGB 2223]|uniref:hypothetical protein n=1 Tax=Mucilaginibacter sp. PPCGB 2223 TaxID=1886027 RepID=UPI0008249CB5|nr:hypothetical protein [Mucilaginibacter sp. PPCGB 2223]OCX51931.1 hypothetical protein BEL04_18185 [Mucilaginibacter sp. PPCGB 2223]